MYGIVDQKYKFKVNTLYETYHEAEQEAARIFAIDVNHRLEELRNDFTNHIIPLALQNSVLCNMVKDYQVVEVQTIIMKK